MEDVVARESFWGEMPERIFRWVDSPWSIADGLDAWASCQRELGMMPERIFRWAVSPLSIAHGLDAWASCQTELEMVPERIFDGPLVHGQ